MPVVYERQFHVSDAIDPDGVSAELKQGILRIHLKKGSAHKSRRIPVSA